MPKRKPKPRVAQKRHDPTPAERDERVKIEGATFKEAVEKVLTAPNRVKDNA
jgi:hypothetical protein